MNTEESQTEPTRLTETEVPNEPEEVTVELAVNELNAGLQDLHELLERLRRVVWQSRLQSEAPLTAEPAPPKFYLSGEAIEERGALLDFPIEEE